MSSPNPFEVLEAEEQSVEIALRNYGWMGRQLFCLFLTGLLLMQFMCVTALRGAQSLTAVLLIVGVGASPRRRAATSTRNMTPAD